MHTPDNSKRWEKIQRKFIEGWAGRASRLNFFVNQRGVQKGVLRDKFHSSPAP